MVVDRASKSEEVILGQRIRELRAARNMTLTELARQVGVSKSLLSQVERGSSNASIGVLRAVAAVLGIPFFQLFVSGQLEGNLVRRDQRQLLHVPGSPIKRELLVPDLHRRMSLIIATLEPGQVSSPDAPTMHDGEECVYVLSGRIEVEAGDEHVILEEGDCLYFNARIPHRMQNVHDGLSQVLAVMADKS